MTVRKLRETRIIQARTPHLMGQVRIGKYVRARCMSCDWKFEGELSEEKLRRQFDGHWK
jgi:hypothetical protein